MSKNTGGPAFPLQAVGPQGEPYSPEVGMTLRDYFAGQALAGLLAHPQGPAGEWERSAKDAYNAADAMITAREAEGGKA